MSQEEYAENINNLIDAVKGDAENKDELINQIVDTLKKDKEDSVQALENSKEELRKNNDAIIAKDEELQTEKNKYIDLQNKYINAFNNGKENEKAKDELKGATITIDELLIEQ